MKLAAAERFGFTLGEYLRGSKRISEKLADVYADKYRLFGNVLIGG